MKKISVEFSDAGISDLIKQLEAYQNSLDRKCSEARRRISEAIADEAQKGFASADSEWVSRIQKGVNLNFQPESPETIVVSIASVGNTSEVKVSGSDVMFIEFGAGVYFNGAAGSSPHPKGEELGYTIGSYGKGYGAHLKWQFTKDGQPYKTIGTPAQMPFWNAVKAAMPKIEQILLEVFKS